MNGKNRARSFEMMPSLSCLLQLLVFLVDFVLILLKSAIFSNSTANLEENTLNSRQLERYCAQSMPGLSGAHSSGMWVGECKVGCAVTFFLSFGFLSCARGTYRACKISLASKLSILAMTLDPDCRSQLWRSVDLLLQATHNYLRLPKL